MQTSRDLIQNKQYQSSSWAKPPHCQALLPLFIKWYFLPFSHNIIMVCMSVDCNAFTYPRGQATAGKRRSTTKEVRIELQKIFERHPGSHLTDAGDTVIPADALVDLFSSLSDGLSDEPLMSGEEIAMFEVFLKTNPGLQVTPQIILNFIEERTKIHPSRSPFSSDDDVATHEEYRGHSRSSSSESNCAVSHPDSNSRPPSRGPPQTPIKSPLDSQRRQRSTPLAAPSSWSTKRPLYHRRKSDAGSRSDSDVCHFLTLIVKF